tara:strand:- start:8522 stop:9649 length:1128 start_codon:yes stop_codon:yes gene_type:complete
MVCPGSVGLSQGVHDPESEFAAEGTAAHALAETCLRSGNDAWEWIGTGNMECDGGKDSGILVSKDMADAVQVYLNAVRSEHPMDQHHDIEFKFHCPSIHPYFYGQADFVFVDHAAKTLHVWDYKHGAGIVVDVKENPQCMYYACGVLEDLHLWEEVEKVVLHIAQPRGFHFDGPLREWAISTDELDAWLMDELVPAMEHALTSREVKSGDHCRFCPVRRHACPQILKDFDELEELMALMEKKGGAKALTNVQLGRFLQLFDIAKMIAKAANETAFARLQSGKVVPGRKLAHSRTNREWKEGAEPAVKLKLGEAAYTTPELKSPAKIDALPEGKSLTARWAFKPQGGLAVVAEGDARVAVGRDTKSLFTDETKGKK